MVGCASAHCSMGAPRSGSECFTDAVSSTRGMNVCSRSHRRSTERDTNSGLTDDAAVSLVGQRSPSSSPRNGPAMCQRLMLTANELSQLNTWLVSELCCTYFRGQAAGSQHSVSLWQPDETAAMPYCLLSTQPAGQWALLLSATSEQSIWFDMEILFFQFGCCLMPKYL